ncbi:MAG: PLP-dependent aminotransferase family protein [Actinomycetota bacterium]|nr:PLP-dependent aminotransferase family protein [Actinomycetota bacterium]
MSYKNELIELRDADDGAARDNRSGVTQAIVAVFEGAITSGELGPGAKLPPTRRLAELTGVNHLTAARAYRQLAERGLVSSKVGSGTFVRAAAAAIPGSSRVKDSIAWQRYVLPEFEETYGDRVLAEMHSHVQTEGLIPLSVGYPSERIFPIEEMRASTERVMATQAERALQYSDVRGTPELAQQVAELSAARGEEEDTEDIVITSGATQGLSLAMRAILRPGDVVACEDPSFMSVIRAIRAAGAKVQPVPMDADGLDVDALEALLARTEIRALAIQPRLHNPTGRDLAPERRERLLELVRRHGFFIVEDGIYGELRMSGEDRPSLRADAPAHAIYTDSLSKTIGGGLRAGWVIASGPVLDRIIAEKRSDDIHTPVLNQLVAADFLAQGHYPAQLERARRHYARGREAMEDSIRRHLGGVAHYLEPLGGGHIWVTLDSPVSERDLVDEAWRQGVAYAPGGAMSVARTQELCLRLSYCYLEPDEMDEGVRRLAAALAALSARPARRAAAPV